MKVFHVCETMLGGVGTYQNEVVSLQQAVLGVAQVRFLGPREDLVQVPDIEKSSIRTFRRPSRLRGLPNLAFGFVREMRAFRPDIVHAHSTFAGVIARLIAPLFGVPVVYCPHGWAMDVYRGRWPARAIGLVERCLAPLAARIVAVSGAEKSRALAFGLPENRIVVLLNGLRAAPPALTPIAWNDTRLKLLFVGRLDRQKGVDVLLKAIAGLHNKLAVRLVGASVADGGGLADLSAFAHVEALGWQSLDRVAAHMAACDVLVVPSRWEGLPLVILEAMRAGKPVLAARVGGIPEAVVDGQTGLLFDSEDASALRAHLLSLTPERCAAMGRAAAQRFAADFTADRLCADLLGLYDEIVAPLAPGRRCP